jgi:hypothetical protein
VNSESWWTADYSTSGVCTIYNNGEQEIGFGQAAVDLSNCSYYLPGASVAFSNILNATLSPNPACGGTSAQLCAASSSSISGTSSTYTSTTSSISIASTSTTSTSSPSPGPSVSKDAMCGGSAGYTCLGSAFGNYCSQNGWCGSSSSYCGEGCQEAFGSCSPTSLTTSPDATCGSSTGYTCSGSSFGNCSSQHGWCGSSWSYCSQGCQSGFGSCS